MNRTYLDACTIIYLVEAANPFHAAALDYMRMLSVDASAVLVTSRLSLLECRVRPLRENNLPLLGAYDELFSASRLIVWDVTAPIIDRATTLRARRNFRTPDAIHLATAIESHADSFLTGDAALESCTELHVVVLPSETR